MDNLPDFYKPCPVTKAALTFANAWRVQVSKVGKNDIEVEVYRAGEWSPVNLTNVMAGEFFLIPNDASLEESKCYQCRQPARSAGGRDRNNPTLVLGVVEIATAPTYVAPSRTALPATTTKSLTFDEKGNIIGE